MAASTDADTDVITLTQGEGDDRLITFRDPNLTDPNDATADLINLSEAIDGTVNRYAVVRFAAKLKPSRQTNASALLLKKSYDPTEIEILDQTSVATRGRVMLKIDEPDTAGKKPDDCYSYEIFLTRQDVARVGASSGTINALTNGSGAVVGVGTDFTLAKVGDVVTVTSGANNLAVSRIEAITDATNMTLERTVWVTDPGPGITFEIRRGAGRSAKVRDSNGERVKIGQLILLQDVVR